MKHSPKIVVLFATSLLLSVPACASDGSSLEELAPKLDYVITGPLAMTVVDNRPFVLNGDKPDTCEGIRRNAYGMPFNFTKLRDDRDTPYTKRIDGIVSAGLTNAGATVTVVPTPKGTPSSGAIDAIKTVPFEHGLVINVLDSRVDAGIARWSYFYDYEIIVVDGAGSTVLTKKFNGEDIDFQRAILKAGRDVEKSYPFGTVLDIEYRNKFAQMLGSGEVQAALGGIGKSAAAANPVGASSVERLSELKKMLDQGLITEQDFEKKKAQILHEM